MVVLPTCLALTDPGAPDSRARAGPGCPGSGALLRGSEARLGLAGWVRNGLYLGAVANHLVGVGLGSSVILLVAVQ